MHYLLFYEADNDYVTRRARFRDEHLAKAWKASERGELILGGALTDPVDRAVLLFKGDSPSVAEEFARSDPYVTGGVVKRWYVREWNTVAGDDAATPVNMPEATKGLSGGPILRMWKARSSPERAADYARHAIQKVFPQLGSIGGHKGAYLLRRSVGNATEFLVLTLWDSMEAVRTFAGTRPSRAVVEPAARAALSHFDEMATHYEVVKSIGSAGDCVASAP
ncbi:MAG TPA: YciI-like protein [Steroidobacteraceae bacterium]|nr:YciI-like protein [Steroidobacteraceae bacterium]